MTDIDDGPRHAGEQSAAISNLVVHLLSEYTGRGPTQARTYRSGDLISVVLQDTLTKGERSLLADGKMDFVLATRKHYQNTMGAALVEGVERLTGRQVLAFLSDNHVDPDIAVETFLLVPNGDSGGAPQHDGVATSG
jgi:uncharacterized protein YbcI